MNEPAAEHFSWGCPSCGRRVPTRVDECRCGFNRQDLPPVPGQEPTNIPTRSGPTASLLVILGAAIGLGVAVYIVQSQKDEPVASVTSETPAAHAGPVERVAPTANSFVAPVTGSVTL